MDQISKVHGNADLRGSVVVDDPQRSRNLHVLMEVPSVEVGGRGSPEYFVDYETGSQLG